MNKKTNLLKQKIEKNVQWFNEGIRNIGTPFFNEKGLDVIVQKLKKFHLELLKINKKEVVNEKNELKQT